MIIIIIPRWLPFMSEEDCVLCDHLWILWWLFKPSLEAQSLEVVGHWNSVVLISAGDALWRLSSTAMTHCCVWPRSSSKLVEANTVFPVDDKHGTAEGTHVKVLQQFEMPAVQCPSLIHTGERSRLHLFRLSASQRGKCYGDWAPLCAASLVLG